MQNPKTLATIVGIWNIIKGLFFTLGILGVGLLAEKGSNGLGTLLFITLLLAVLSYIATVGLFMKKGWGIYAFTLAVVIGGYNVLTNISNQNFISYLILIIEIIAVVLLFISKDKLIKR